MIPLTPQMTHNEVQRNFMSIVGVSQIEKKNTFKHARIRRYIVKNLNFKQGTKTISFNVSQQCDNMSNADKFFTDV